MVREGGTARAGQTGKWWEAGHH